MEARNLAIVLAARCFLPDRERYAPNEYMVIQPKEGLPIADLAEIERPYVDMLFALAGV